MATDGLVDTRRAVQALRGVTAGLEEQIGDLARTHRNRHHASVGFQIEGEPLTLAPEATVALSRTAQEALVNTAKHAPHQPVDIRLTYDDNGVRLAISNTLATPGAAPGEATAAFSSVNGGYGLVGMRERLLLINGTLTTGSDQRCWTVTAEVPQSLRHLRRHSGASSPTTRPAFVRAWSCCWACCPTSTSSPQRPTVNRRSPSSPSTTRTPSCSTSICRSSTASTPPPA